MLRRNGIFITLSLALGVVFVISVRPAHAASACALTKDDFVAIQRVQADPTLTYNQELSQELALRKSLLDKTIGCAEADAKNLKIALASATTTNADAITVQENLKGQIDDLLGYYALELQKADASGIAGTQGVAQTLLSWRKGTYVPLANKVSNFLLWYRNQPLFQTADTRLGQIKQIVSFLAPSGDNELSSAFASAQSTFRNAQSQNDDALQSMVQDNPPDEVLPVIQQSLKSLADTYQQFFAVSAIIQGIDANKK